MKTDTWKCRKIVVYPPGAVGGGASRWETVVRLVDISRAYGLGNRHVQAVRGLNAEFPAGTWTAIVGPSGSGKTTLLNLIGALDRPSSGRVEIDGRDVGTMGDAARTRFRRTHIGFIFQFFNLLPTLTAAENVALVAELAGRSGRESHDRAKDLLDRVGLGARARHRPDELSGGEMQRVAIARALMMDPPLLVADEPTGNLDTRTGATILDLLRATAGSQRTVVLVTHDPAIAATADRVLTMRDGQLLQEAA